MTTSESVNEIAAALAKAQAGMKNAVLDKVNPHFKNRYASLASVRDVVTPALSANGISVVQTIDATADNQTFLRTRLMHVSGQWVESLCPIHGAGDMQKMGSAITYARRYSLSAICGIAADEDDDANAAATPPAARQKSVPAVPPGYDDWLTDLEATALEGSEALKAAWLKSQPYLRKHLTDTDNARWEALKAKSASVKEPVSA